MPAWYNYGPGECPVFNRLQPLAQRRSNDWCWRWLLVPVNETFGRKPTLVFLSPFQTQGKR